MVYIMYMYVQARWAHSAGNSTVENLCIISFYIIITVMAEY